MKRAVLAAIAGISALCPAHGTIQDDPLLRPIEAEYSARWLTPQAPLHVYGNSWLIGFGGLNVALIRTDAGLILIDGAVPQGVRAIEANVRALGFRIEDIKMILSTEPHYDHAGGIAALARDSGALVIAGNAAAPALRSGRPTQDDPQVAYGIGFPGTPRVRGVANGTRLRLGNTIVTARAVPGHTPGSTSWTWQSCERGRCLDLVFSASLNPVAGKGYRFADPAHAAAVAAFRRSFASVRALPCDILLTSHPDQSGGDVKARRRAAGASPNPFIDPGACRAYADRFEAALDRRLADEGMGTAE